MRNRRAGAYRLRHGDRRGAPSCAKTVGADVVYFKNAGNAEIPGFDREVYAGLKRKFLTTAKLIGNLWAFDRWYEAVRLPYAEEHEKPF